ncbi:DUF6089 family protein [Mucilaginibacter sp. dw_454]|uniref:type IX secretion system protein PorG n=1 Tax=Mucilaginibacter sp. dw_454 TaxID=2720079 RepID=UPI001BD56A7A|nr:DUF6089 family protein [Mucilaginibacter sp. dw_454]
MYKSLLIVLFTAISLNLHAQAWEVGGFGGGAGYMGDLNQKNPLKVSGVAAGVFAWYNFNGYISLGIGANYGVISAADSLSSNLQNRIRNLSFTTRLLETSFTAEFNFMEFVPSVSKNLYTPYILFGIAYTNYNPQANYMGETYNLRDYQTEGVAYKNTTIAVPFGVGIKYNIAGRLTLAGSLGYRTAYTDYLDDVSGVYPNKAKLNNPVSVALSDRSATQIGTAGTQRGDLRPHDTYFFTGFSISYTFITQKCYYE